MSLSAVQQNDLVIHIHCFLLFQALSHVQIFCDPLGCSPPGSSVHGILQARILEWAATPSSRGSSSPKDQTHKSYMSCIGRPALNHQHHLGNQYHHNQSFLNGPTISTQQRVLSLKPRKHPTVNNVISYPVLITVMPVQRTEVKVTSPTRADEDCFKPELMQNCLKLQKFWSILSSLFEY